MAENPTDETPSAGLDDVADASGSEPVSRKKARKKTSATRFFLRGLAISLPPILTIEPGDTIRFRTLEAGWATS